MFSSDGQMTGSAWAVGARPMLLEEAVEVGQVEIVEQEGKALRLCFLDLDPPAARRSRRQQE